MKNETMIAMLEGTPRRQRGQVLHDLAVKAVATWSQERIDAVRAAFVGHPAAGAFENLVWESSFEK